MAQAKVENRKIVSNIWVFHLKSLGEVCAFKIPKGQRANLKGPKARRGEKGDNDNRGDRLYGKSSRSHRKVSEEPG